MAFHPNIHELRHVSHSVGSEAGSRLLSDIGCCMQGLRPVRKGLLGLRRQEVCCLAIRQSSHLGCALGVFLL